MRVAMKIFLLLLFPWIASAWCIRAADVPGGGNSWPRCAPALPGDHILFLGNSYTFFNRMPAMVKAMADSRGLRPDVHLHAAPAASFRSHWNDESARSKVGDTAWNFVILQDQSATPILNPEHTMEFGGKWCARIRAAQGAPVLFLTWGIKGASGIPDPREQQALLDTYLKLARREKAAVAPVGVAWENCLKRYPGISLYQADGQHPTVEGSYLTACVMYCTLFGKSPVGLPGKLSLKGVLLCSIPADTARKLQTAAMDTCRQLFAAPAKKRPGADQPSPRELPAHSAKSTRKTGAGSLS